MRTRNAEDKKRRILAAAQVFFSERGYTQTSIKDVADRAEVSASLVMLHFRSKRELFRETLISVLTHTGFAEAEKTGFAERVADQIMGAPGQVFSPFMIALSLEDEEARQVAAEVARDYILGPTSRWLGGPDGLERAQYMMILGLGLSLFRRLFAEDAALRTDAPPARWIAEAIQGAVEGGSRD